MEIQIGANCIESVREKPHRHHKCKMHTKPPLLFQIKIQEFIGSYRKQMLVFPLR